MTRNLQLSNPAYNFFFECVSSLRYFNCMTTKKIQKEQKKKNNNVVKNLENNFPSCLTAIETNKKKSLLSPTETVTSFFNSIEQFGIDRTVEKYKVSRSRGGSTKFCSKRDEKRIRSMRPKAVGFCVVGRAQWRTIVSTNSSHSKRPCGHRNDSRV